MLAFWVCLCFISSYVSASEEETDASSEAFFSPMGSSDELLAKTKVIQQVREPQAFGKGATESSSISSETFVSLESIATDSHENATVAQEVERSHPSSTKATDLSSSSSEMFASLGSNAADSLERATVTQQVKGSQPSCTTAIELSAGSSENQEENQHNSTTGNENDRSLDLCPLTTRRLQGAAFTCTEDQHCQAMKMICCIGVCARPIPHGPKAHTGSCLALPIRPIRKATCANDDDCADDEKCCQNGPEIHCVKASRLRNFNRKPGYCGHVRPDEQMTQYKLCNGDTDCFRMDKCCPTSTTRRCVPPLSYAPEPKRGHCKMQSPYVLPVITPSCYDDYDCVGIQKCCYDGRHERCMNPASNLTHFD
uniref:WAP domain-containing protein n=1 Tax=Trichuris muris TaxID=70415 RepID=A0A5S6QH28_TRIMR